MKAAAIIQARMRSTRLPGKILMKVQDKTILEYVIDRVAQAKTISKVVVATTDKADDKAVIDLLEKKGIDVYAGSEDDVLDRYYQAARQYNLQHIVRITADCPLLDPDVIDTVVEMYFKTGKAYYANILERTYPDGMDVEVFGFTALERAWQDAKLPSEREHVTTFIRNHPEMFRLGNVRHIKNLADKRWTLDQAEDFEFIRQVLTLLGPKNNFRMADVLEILRKNPDLEKINQHIATGEGYVKSLAKDREAIKK